MSLLDDMAYAFGFGFGAKATDEAFNAVSNSYRAKDFDPVVRRDLMELMEKGRLSNIAYPFPRKMKAQKKPIFFVRHKIFSAGVLLYFIIIMILPRELFKTVGADVALIFGFFFIFCIIGMFIKRVLRKGKKMSDAFFQTEFINQGQKYWNIREYVRQALETGELNVQDAYVRIRNTELGRQLPDSDTELEAKVFNNKRRG